MKVLGVVGPSDSGKTSLVAELAGALSAQGSVATVKHLTHAPDVDTEGKDTDRHRCGGARETYGLYDGGWFATGADLSLAAALERLAPAHDYALVEGYTAGRLPKVALGGADAAPPVVAAAPDADAVDVAAVREAVADLPAFETLASLVARAREGTGGDPPGSVATVSGRVRGEGPDARSSGGDAAPDARLAAIRASLRSREGVRAVLIHRQPGFVRAGGDDGTTGTGGPDADADAVFVVVAAGRHETALATVEAAVDSLAGAVGFVDTGAGDGSPARDGRE